MRLLWDWLHPKKVRAEKAPEIEEAAPKKKALQERSAVNSEEVAKKIAPLAKKIREYILDHQDKSAQEDRWRTTMKRDMDKSFRKVEEEVQKVKEEVKETLQLVKNIAEHVNNSSSTMKRETMKCFREQREEVQKVKEEVKETLQLVKNIAELIKPH